MQITTLGRTGLEVSVAGLGCGGHSRLGQFQGASFEHSVGIVKTALDEGVTFIDTAEAYNTEEIVGEAVKGRRDEVVISTKVSIHVVPFAENPELIDADTMELRVEGCLNRLGIETIDVLHLHGIGLHQYDYCVSEFLPRMKRLQDQGKIRFTGITERFGSETQHDMSVRAANEALFDVMMIGLNYLNQTALKTVLPKTQQNNIGTLCMFAVRGPLASKQKVEALIEKLVAAGEIDPSDIDAGDPIGFLTAPGVAETMTEAAYRFCRHAPGMDVTITGTGNRDHLLDNLRAIGMPPLPKDVVERLTTIFAHASSETGEPPHPARASK